MQRSLFILLLTIILVACGPDRVAEPGVMPSPGVTSTPVPLPSATAQLLPPSPSPLAIDPPVTPAPTLSPTRDELVVLDAVSRIPNDQVDLARQLGPCRDNPDACPRVARTMPLEVRVGEVRPFYISNMDDDTNFEITAELRYVGPIVLFYVEVGLDFDQAALEEAARRFEKELYPRTRAIFGSEVMPGVDGDPRITILNARDPGGGVIGYFAARDSLPRQVNRFSNEREMFFMNLNALAFDNPAYLDVLVHEFQHMIHRNEQPTTAVWFNEGCSMLAEDLNGFVTQGYAVTYLLRTDTQLTGWADAPGQTIPHYGAAHLFMRYIYAQYAEEDDLQPLIRANAGVELTPFVELAARRRPDIDNFGTLFIDWAIANLLNDPAVGDGRYSYPPRPGMPEWLSATVQPVALEPGDHVDQVAQFGVDYYALPPGPLTLRFNGDPAVNLVGERPRDGYGWWSSRGDNSYATLTRAIDLRNVTTATLSFDAWYEIESDYDYAFVTVSTDGGSTWQTLPSSSATTSDPQGNNYGYGLTGISGTSARSGDGVRGSWVEEQVDLTAYAGQELLLRFWQISDEGYNAPGFLIDNLRISEIGFTDTVENGETGWVAEGFVRVDGILDQQWALRLVRTDADGTVRVEPLSVDEQGQITARLAAGENGVIMIAGITPYTSERASYTLEIITEE